jgi:hypothetical protein
MAEIFDHTGAAVTHGRARVNGIRMHYVTAGQGAPLLLLHGTPKTHFYWYKLIPLLTPYFRVVAQICVALVTPISRRPKRDMIA